ncbi:hypothetical protein LCGC14_0668140 [marine sediment metagenome]|uniref:Uncharacterized protein n=1 Tax=marine sediment metagenome TaxID=412755 RepID=A0A0F9QWS9_9ZZZZ
MLSYLNIVEERKRDMDIDVIKDKIEYCLQILREKDQDLLDIEVNERTITHKLAEYIQDQFPNYDVDCEYNRYEKDTKRIRSIKNRSLDITKLKKYQIEKLIWEDKKALTIYPDIIIHKRKSPNNNLLIIEVKKSSNNKGEDFDIKKIEELMEPPYKYKFGLFLRIGIQNENNKCKWFPR